MNTKLKLWQLLQYDVNENRFTGKNEVKKKFGEVKSQNFNIICKKTSTWRLEQAKELRKKKELLKRLIIDCFLLLSVMTLWWPVLSPVIIVSYLQYNMSWRILNNV